MTTTIPTPTDLQVRLNAVAQSVADLAEHASIIGDEIAAIVEELSPALPGARSDAFVEKLSDLTAAFRAAS